SGCTAAAAPAAASSSCGTRREGCALVQEALRPELEAERLPQRFAAVDAALDMVGQQGVRRGRLQEAAFAEPAAGEGVLGKRAQGAAEPVRQRDREALLGLAGRARWQPLPGDDAQ